MPITLCYGLPGRAKTHFSTYYSLALAEKYHKKLVLNYQLHPDNLVAYCRNMGYQWLLNSMASEPTIYYCDMEESRDSFLSIPDTVCVCDETSGYFPARGSTSNTPKSFIKDLTQVRHRRQYVIFIAQSQEQIDLAIKVLAEEVIQCNGVSIYDADIGSQRLLFKVVRRFTVDKYASWSNNPRLRSNPLKTHLMANKSWLSMLTVADSKLFDVYSSFALVHGGKIDFPDSSRQYYYPSLFFPDSSGSISKSKFRSLDLDSLDSSPIQNDMSYDFFPFIPLIPFFLISSKFKRFLYSYLPSDVLPISTKLKTRFQFRTYPFITLSSGRRVYLKYDNSSLYHRISLCIISCVVIVFGLNVLSFLLSVF